MLYVYLIASAALIPLINNFTNILRQPYSWWLVPLLFVGFFLGFIILHAAVLYFTVIPVRLDSPQERFSGYYRRLITSTIRLLVPLLGVHIHSNGKEKMPDEGRVMVVCNHLHEIDPAVIINEFPDLEIGFIAKKEIYVTMPFVARALHKMHCLPIDRENDREAAKTVVSAIKKIKDDVVSIGVFPEGYCSKDGELQPLRNGVFKIAQKANVPVVVCALTGTTTFMKNIFRRPTHIYFDVIETIPAERVSSMTTAELGGYVHSLMEETIKKQREHFCMKCSPHCSFILCV